jgi:hypothetical protein
MNPPTGSHNYRLKWSYVFNSKVSSIAATGIVAFGLYTLVRRYGWNGALLFIWEGDPLPKEIREFVDTLSDASYSLNELEDVLRTLENGLEIARLNCLNENSPPTVLSSWILNLPHSLQDIRKSLAKISYELDEIASRIDQIPSKAEVKQKKKTLSGNVVSLMSRTDRLIEFFTVATEERLR